MRDGSCDHRSRLDCVSKVRTRRAREAGDSIKPGARAPGSRNQKQIEPANAGDSLLDRALSPASRAPCPFLILILGLAPQALCCRPLRGLGAQMKRSSYSTLLSRVLSGASHLKQAAPDCDCDGVGS